MKTTVAATLIGLLLVAAGVLLTRAIIAADRERQQADILRVALWRLDARAGAVILGEASRAPETYQSFWSPDEAFTGQPSATRARLPSPLLDLPTTPLWLHLTWRAGRLRSPQVPQGDERALALREGLQANELGEAYHRLSEIAPLVAARAGELFSDLPEPPTVQERTPSSPVATGTVESMPSAAQKSAAPPPATTAIANDLLQDGLPSRVSESALQSTTTTVSTSPQQDFTQRALSNDELQQQVKSSANFNVFGSRRSSGNTHRTTTRDRDASAPAIPPPSVGLFQARWLDDHFLLVARRARLNGNNDVQIAVITWSALRTRLLESVVDLLPNATLIPRQPNDPESNSLAALPVRLVPGPWPTRPLDSATRWTLSLAWGALLTGLLGAAGLILAMRHLAERRAAFVSAVTHELRTPLTALRLHADLLADARIDGDPERRQQRVGIVRAEADRLTHLIDNVLDYARLERRRAPQSRPIAVQTLLEPIVPLLRQRCATAGLELVVADLPAAVTACDPAAVERILVNVIDNAAKYATGSGHITMSVRFGRRLEIRVRDHGPGLAADVRHKLFVPFSRSAEAAAGAAPGVGLGLALCRRLARAQGGDLRLERPDGGGVEAVLELPLG